MCRSKKSHIKDIRYSLFLQQKSERGKKLLHNCNKCSMSIENTENENSYTRRKIVILKTLAISKILCQSLITTVSRHIGNEQDISK